MNNVDDKDGAAVTEDDFHPDLVRVARLVPREVSPSLLPIIRAVFKVRAWRTPPEVDKVVLPSGVHIRLQRPHVPADTGPGLLWIHGGGYITGSAAQDDVLCRRFAEEIGATVAAVNYRLAPEHPYPCALQDCYSSLLWLAALPAVDPNQLVIAGASAGGGLAAALAIFARDHSELAIAAQLLVYPMLDDRSATQPGLEDSRHRLWTRRSNLFGWSCYLGDADPTIAVPSRTQDLSDLPAAWIGVGTRDLFHAENLAYAKRLRASGVPCHLEVIEGAFHGFDAIAPKAQVSQNFWRSQIRWLQATLAARH